MLQNHKNRGVEYLIPNYNLMDFGVYSFTQKTFKTKWTLAGGLRLDSRIIQSKKLILDSLGAATNVEDSTTLQKVSAFGKNYLGFSGSVGLSYQITKTSTLKLNVSRGFRAPNIAELSSNGRHEGTFRY